MDASTNLIVVIILQYIHESSHHIIHLKLTRYINCISIKLEKKILIQGFPVAHGRQPMPQGSVPLFKSRDGGLPWRSSG